MAGFFVCFSTRMHYTHVHEFFSRGLHRPTEDTSNLALSPLISVVFCELKSESMGMSAGSVLTSLQTSLKALRCLLSCL